VLAFLRILDGLWLLGALFVAFLRDENSPNSVGAGFLWHFCANDMTPPVTGGRGVFVSALLRSCVGLSRGAFGFWHFCVVMTAPVIGWERRLPFGVSARAGWPLPWGIVIKALLRHVSVPLNWLGRARRMWHC